MRHLLIVLLVIGAAVGAGAAQEKPAPTGTTKTAEASLPAAPVAPALTDVQKLSIAGLAKDMQIAQLQAQAAQAAYAKALAELQQMVTALQVPGFDLDLQTMTYTPKPAEKPKGGV
jgi:hypothetical protein